MRRHASQVARIIAAIALLAAAWHAAPGPPEAEWPSRPVRIIVPAPAGGSYDRAIRVIARQLSADLRQPVIVDNRPGAGNIAGTLAGARAAPDGYTLTMTGMMNAIAAGLYDRVPFDIVGDFVHAGTIGAGAQALLVRGDSAIGSLPELLQEAKRVPRHINYATSGTGSTGHLLLELLQRAAGISLTHVPYKGAAPALQDLVAGTVDFAVLSPNAATSMIRAGRVRVLAVSSAARAPPFLDVPTLAELGYPQLTVTAWVGLSVPRGTPAGIVARVNVALRACLDNPDVLGPLEADGLFPMRLSPQEHADLVRGDTERWAALTRSLGLKAD